jgi:transaldolase
MELATFDSGFSITGIFPHHNYLSSIIKLDKWRVRMQIWLDTAKIEEIREAASWGVITGVTTNPSLMNKAGTADRKTVTQEIAAIVNGPVSAEVISTEAKGMIDEAREIITWSEHVVVKIPTTIEGLKAMKEISSWEPAKKGWPRPRVNSTLIFSPNQALLAATAGAAFVSPFLGRLDDIGHDGMQVVRDIVDIFDIYGWETQVIAASIRHPLHVTEAALAGSHIATMPFSVLQKMIAHPLTDSGLKSFLNDWAKVTNK